MRDRQAREHRSLDHDRLELAENERARPEALLEHVVESPALCDAALGDRDDADSSLDRDKMVELVAAGLLNSGSFQVMAKTLKGDLGGIKFELSNARKDVRYYTHLARNLGTPSLVGEAVHQSLVLACAFGYGKTFVPSLVEAQEQLTDTEQVPS